MYIYTILIVYRSKFSSILLFSIRVVTPIHARTVFAYIVCRKTTALDLMQIKRYTIMSIWRRT